MFRVFKKEIARQKEFVLGMYLTFLVTFKLFFKDIYKLLLVFNILKLMRILSRNIDL